MEKSDDISLKTSLKLISKNESNKPFKNPAKPKHKKASKKSQISKKKTNPNHLTIIK